MMSLFTTLYDSTSTDQHKIGILYTNADHLLYFIDRQTQT